MKVLIIDIGLLPLAAIYNENSKAFFILYKLVKNLKLMATYFADWSFSHSFIGNNSYLLSNTKQLKVNLITLLLIKIFWSILLWNNIWPINKIDETRVDIGWKDLHQFFKGP